MTTQTERDKIYELEAKIDALQTHLARCRDAFKVPTPDLGRLGDPWCAAMASPDAIPTFVEQSVKQLEADAARYRWLRDTQNTACRESGEYFDRVGVIENIMAVVDARSTEAPHPNELDAVIDRAMKGGA